MHRNTVPVGYDDALDVFGTGNHAFRTDIVGVLRFLNIASACVLVVTAEGFEYFADGDIKRKQGVRVDGYFVLFQIAAEAVDLHNSGYAG